MNDPDRRWHVAFQMAMTHDQLEALAEGIEAGEVQPGACIVSMDAEHYDQIDPELVKRLKGFIERKA